MDDAFTYIKGNTKVESIINIYLTNNASVTEPITPINGKTIYIQSMDMDDGNPVADTKVRVQAYKEGVHDIQNNR